MVQENLNKHLFSILQKGVVKMKSYRFFSKVLKPQFLSALVLLSLVLTPLGAVAPAGPMAEVIVQAQDAASAAALVQSVGGTVTHELDIIDAVGAQLSPAQLDMLRGQGQGLRIYPNGQVHAAQGSGTSSSTPDTAFPRLVDAPILWGQGITGQGVAV